jgi:ATP-dependent Clp protease protease subunit
MANELPLPKERNLFFSKQVDQESIVELTKKIIEINEDDELIRKTYIIHGFSYHPKPINIYIDSYGGSVYQCFGLLSVMQQSKTPVHTIVTGCAMSCGFMILISGHKRFAYELATPLYHQVSSFFGGGKLKDIEEDIKETQRLQTLLEKITLERTKIKKDKLEKIFKRKIDWFMSAEEALKLGVVDEIIK